MNTFLTRIMLAAGLAVATTTFVGCDSGSTPAEDAMPAKEAMDDAKDGMKDAMEEGKDAMGDAMKEGKDAMDDAKGAMDDMKKDAH